MSKTEKELLELAAKAAGYPIHSDAWACGPGGAAPKLYMGNGGLEWNPLKDDGDALRLAVKLCMLDENPTFQYYLANEQCRFDSQLAATRRAIVLTAAGIGGLMP